MKVRNLKYFLFFVLFIAGIFSTFNDMNFDSLEKNEISTKVIDLKRISFRSSSSRRSSWSSSSRSSSSSSSKSSKFKSGFTTSSSSSLNHNYFRSYSDVYFLNSVYRNRYYSDSMAQEQKADADLYLTEFCKDLGAGAFLGYGNETIRCQSKNFNASELKSWQDKKIEEQKKEEAKAQKKRTEILIVVLGALLVVVVGIVYFVSR